MKSSKLTSKYQATIPKEIRERLGLKAGDAIIFRMSSDGTIVLKKAEPFDTIYLEALSHTLSEWDSYEDDQAFEHLQNI